MRTPQLLSTCLVSEPYGCVHKTSTQAGSRTLSQLLAHFSGQVIEAA